MPAHSSSANCSSCYWMVKGTWNQGTRCKPIRNLFRTMDMFYYTDYWHLLTLIDMSISYSHLVAAAICGTGRTAGTSQQQYTRPGDWDNAFGGGIKCPWAARSYGDMANITSLLWRNLRFVGLQMAFCQVVKARECYELPWNTERKSWFVSESLNSEHFLMASPDHLPQGLVVSDSMATWREGAVKGGACSIILPYGEPRG